MQPAFVGELFSLLHQEGIHTALDTSGVWATGAAPARCWSTRT